MESNDTVGDVPSVVLAIDSRSSGYFVTRCITNNKHSGTLSRLHTSFSLHFCQTHTHMTTHDSLRYINILTYLLTYLHTHTHTPVKLVNYCCVLFTIRNTFCGTWYLPHSHVHNERTVPIILARCITHARNGHTCISTSGLKSDVTIVFFDPHFLIEAKISAIRVHLMQI